MSRTKRKYLDGYLHKKLEEGGDAKVKGKFWLKKRKMKPYTSDNKIGFGKFQVDGFDGGTGYIRTVSSTEKLQVKNANRSLKKSNRQQSKKDIKNYLNGED